MLWHTLSRSCDHVHTISTAFQITIIQLAFFYYSLLFVRLVEIVVNIIDLLISCTSYNWIIGQFAINYLFFYRLYSRLIYTRWKKKKDRLLLQNKNFSIPVIVLNASAQMIVVKKVIIMQIYAKDIIFIINNCN